MSTTITTAGFVAESNADDSTEPIVCDLTAIPADRRDAHFELARTLLFGTGQTVHEITDGLLFELPADRLADVSRFIENERLCCRHLAFVLEVPPGGRRLRLRVTGPAAREELRALASPMATR
jgi:hypothetical protein